MREVIEHPLAGITFRIPLPYLKVGLGSSGFALWIRADDFGPFDQRNAHRIGQDGIDLTVSTSRFDAESSVRRRISITIHGSQRHAPAHEAAVVDDLDFGPVPAGLRFFRALPARGPGSGERSDMFAPDEAIEGSGIYDIREAIFCKSPESDNIRDGSYPARARPCHWYLPYRDFELTMSLDRRHLARWQRVRAGVIGLLDSFLAEPTR